MIDAKEKIEQGTVPMDQEGRWKCPYIPSLYTQCPIYSSILKKIILPHSVTNRSLHCYFWFLSESFSTNSLHSFTFSPSSYSATRSHLVSALSRGPPLSPPPRLGAAYPAGYSAKAWGGGAWGRLPYISIPACVTWPLQPIGTVERRGLGWTRLGAAPGLNRWPWQRLRARVWRGEAQSIFTTWAGVKASPHFPLRGRRGAEFGSFGSSQKYSDSADIYRAFTTGLTLFCRIWFPG